MAGADNFAAWRMETSSNSEVWTIGQLDGALPHRPQKM
jgi:hypothetical protein